MLISCKKWAHFPVGHSGTLLDCYVHLGFSSQFLTSPDTGAFTWAPVLTSTWYQYHDYIITHLLTCTSLWHNNRMTRSGDFWPKNATHIGYFPANLQMLWAIFRQNTEVWAIPLSKFWFWHFLELFGYFWGHYLVALHNNASRSLTFNRCCVILRQVYSIACMRHFLWWSSIPRACSSD